jgi:hypothetical protein
VLTKLLTPAAVYAAATAERATSAEVPVGIFPAQHNRAVFTEDFDTNGPKLIETSS